MDSNHRGNPAFLGGTAPFAFFLGKYVLRLPLSVPVAVMIYCYFLSPFLKNLFL